MGKNIHVSRISFSVSGTGVAVGQFEFMPVLAGPTQTSSSGATNTTATYIRYSGRLLRFYVREPSGGTATAATFYFLNNSVRTGTKATAPSTAAKDDYVAYTSSVPITASATTPSLDTPFDAMPVFKDSLTLIIDVTAAAGAWTFQGYVELSEG